MALTLELLQSVREFAKMTDSNPSTKNSLEDLVAKCGTESIQSSLNDVWILGSSVMGILADTLPNELQIPFHEARRAFFGSRMDTFNGILDGVNTLVTIVKKRGIENWELYTIDKLSTGTNLNTRLHFQLNKKDQLNPRNISFFTTAEGDSSDSRLGYKIDSNGKFYSVFDYSNEPRGIPSDPITKTAPLNLVSFDFGLNEEESVVIKLGQDAFDAMCASLAAKPQD